MPKPKKIELEKVTAPKALKPVKVEKADKEKKKKIVAAVKAEAKPVEVPAKIEKKTTLIAKLKKTPVAKAVVAAASKVVPAALVAPAPEPVITNDDIALRAYFIAERREAMGWPGDSAQDWIEAERQLKAEAKKKSKR